MAIPQSFLQDLIARADVVEIVGRHVQLRKSGANYVGLCPFHAEKSPSFSVSPSKQFYYCFGCGKGGNAIGFLTDYAGLGFVDAVRDLAQQYGMQVPDDGGTPQDRERAARQREQHATLAQVLEKAADAYRAQLRSAPVAIEYLKRRGLTGTTARRFGLGFAPAGWQHLSSVFARYDDPLLEESGLVVSSLDEQGGERKRYDRFRERIMFPIRNVKGECIGFGGRVLGDEKPKYLNSPETPLFSKGRELYGLFEAREALREAGHALVTEGYMDVVALAQSGFANVVATLGTACTAEHLRLLFRFTDAVVFAFDGDAAGQRAARRALEAALPFASDTRSVKFLFLPVEHDPDSFVRALGREAFARANAAALPLSRFLVDTAREGCDLAQAEGRARLASQARPLCAALPDGALKRQLLGEIASLAELAPRELGEVWELAASRAESHARYSKNSEQAIYGGRERPNFPSKRPGAGARRMPASRADHALRLLLGRPALWDALSGEDHALLCELPAEHGQLFAWFESQMHEHGAQPWGALREGLRGHPAEDFALARMSAELAADARASRPQAGLDGPGPNADAPPARQHDADADAAAQNEAAAELRGVLDRMLVERLKRLETEALAAAGADAQALARYRELQRRRREIETSLARP